MTYEIQQTPFIVITYILELEAGKYYVGRTTNLNRRLAEHISQDYKGSLWTDKYKFVCLLEARLGDTEVETTIEMINRYGFENVRGGPWCRTDY